MTTAPVIVELPLRTITIALSSNGGEVRFAPLSPGLGLFRTTTMPRRL